jgi:cyclopropane fatty-acyl-phospholipid synthase-like methyltransferase
VSTTLTIRVAATAADREPIRPYTIDVSLLTRRVDDIATHYVRTLQAWRASFLAQVSSVRGLGFDRFMRMWDYYLAISETGFATGLTQDLQLVLEKGRGIG